MSRAPLSLDTSAAGLAAVNRGPRPDDSLMIPTATKARALFVADVLAHLVSWSVLDLYVSSTFWFNLNPRSFSYSVQEPTNPLPYNALLFFSYIGVPFLLLIRPLVRLFRRFFYYLTAIPVLCLALKHVPYFDSEHSRTLLLFVGSCSVLFRYVASFARPLDDGRRFQYPMASTIGLLLLQIVRWSSLSTNPLSVRTHAVLILLGGVISVVATRIVIREERRQYKEEARKLFTEADRLEQRRLAQEAAAAAAAGDDDDGSGDDSGDDSEMHADASPTGAATPGSGDASPPSTRTRTPGSGAKKRRAASAESSGAAGLPKLAPLRLKRVLSVSTELYWASAAGFQPIGGWGRTLAWVLSGVLMGSHLFVVAWLFNESGVIPRWVGLHPYPWAVCVMVSFAGGIALSLLYPLLTIRTAYLSLALVGTPLLAYGDGYTGLLGGCIISLALPAYNFCLFGRNSLFAHASVTIWQQLAVAGVVFSVLFFASVGVLFGRSAPYPLSELQHSPQALLFASVGLMWGSAFLERQIGNRLIRRNKDGANNGKSARISVFDPVGLSDASATAASDAGASAAASATATYAGSAQVAAAAVSPPTGNRSLMARLGRHFRRATSLFTHRRTGISSVDQERRYRALWVLGLVVALVLLPTALYRVVTHRVIYIDSTALHSAHVTSGNGNDGGNGLDAPPLPHTAAEADTHDVVSSRLSSERGFVVMTMNAQQGHDQKGKFNGDGLADLVRRYNASIVGLQESDSVHMFTGNVDILGYLSEVLHMEEHYGLSTRMSSVGVAVLSHLALGPVQVFPMPTTRGVGEEAAGKCLQRQLLETSFRYGGTTVALLITHVEYHCITDRRLQTEFIAERIGRIRGPLLVLGDFNLQPSAPEMHVIFDTGVQDATIAAGTNTNTEMVVGEGHVDFILYRDLRLIDADVSDVHDVSDHRPVIATFGLLDPPTDAAAPASSTSTSTP